jgi:hypothetical protein
MDAFGGEEKKIPSSSVSEIDHRSSSPNLTELPWLYMQGMRLAINCNETVVQYAVNLFILFWE